MNALSQGRRNDGRVSGTAQEQITSHVATQFHHEELVGLADGMEELFVSFTRELTIALEVRSGLDQIDGIGFAHHHIVLGHFDTQGAFGDQTGQDVGASLLTVEHVRVEVRAQLTTQLIQMLTLGVVKIHDRDRVTAHFCQSFICRHAVIAVDTRNHKRRNDEDHGDTHHQTLMSTKRLKHF